MSKKLWISLPQQEANLLRGVIGSIKSKNLSSLSVNQLIEKIQNDQAADWFEVLREYNAIPSVNNLNHLQMLDKAKKVRGKFEEKKDDRFVYPNLPNKTFNPNELLSLIILCYSNPNLIGPRLRTALNDNNTNDIKKEILENSARVGNKVSYWASNLRLLNYALYVNDTSVRLPASVQNKIKQGMGSESLEEIDDQGVDVRYPRAIAFTKIDDYSYAVLQSLRSSEEDDDKSEEALLSSKEVMLSLVSAPQISHSGNGSELTPEILPLHATSSNTVNSSNCNSLIIGSLMGVHILRNLPIISPVLCNVSKDVVAAGKQVISFFSKNNAEHTEQPEQKTALVSQIAKP